MSKQLIPAQALSLPTEEAPAPSPAPKPEETVEARLNYYYYEGEWTELPDFDALTVVKSGTVSNFSLAPRQQDDYYAFVFEGMIEIQEAGEYTFFTNSDDGSKLWIDGQLVVDNDGRHSARERSGAITLPAGLHPIRLAYFEAHSAETLEVYWQSAGMSKQLVPENVLFSRVNARAISQTSKGTFSESKTLVEEKVEIQRINSLKLFPNPVQSRFTVILEEVYSDVTIKIVNMNGNKVLEEKLMAKSFEVEVDLYNYQIVPGQYIVLVSSGGKVVGKTTMIKQ